MVKNFNSSQLQFWPFNPLRGAHVVTKFKTHINTSRFLNMVSKITTLHLTPLSVKCNTTFLVLFAGMSLHLTALGYTGVHDTGVCLHCRFMCSI